MPEFHPILNTDTLLPGDTLDSLIGTTPAWIVTPDLLWSPPTTGIVVSDARPASAAVTTASAAVTTASTAVTIASTVVTNLAASLDTTDQAVLGPLARSAFDLTGAGIKIGILSNSFAIAGGEGAVTAQQAAGELPASVTILKDGMSGDDDEGRAMANVIDTIAPGASIDFYSIDGGAADFAQGITALADAGCTIIVDDASYEDEPFFQNTGAITQAVEWAITSEGVSYFTAAGNFDADYYQANFSGVANVALPGINGTHTVHEVSNGEGGTTPYIRVNNIPSGSLNFTLEWDQPFRDLAAGVAGPTYDLQVAFYDTTDTTLLGTGTLENGNPVVIGTIDNTSGAAEAVDMVFYDSFGVISPSNATFKLLFFDNGGIISGPLLGSGSGADFGHALATGANVVSAVDYDNVTTAGTGVTATSPEYFDSTGPGETLISQSGSILATAETLDTPTITAPDGSGNATFGSFSGTSAAVSAAAGVAALIEQEDPHATPAQVTKAIDSTAGTISNDINDVGGAGEINAYAAVASLAPVVTACYLIGTAIATPDGARAIETLAPGDRVLTARGEARPIRWIGERAYQLPFAGATAQPIRIAAGALGGGLPRRDLLVSPRHAMALDGRLVAAEALLGRPGVTRARRADIVYRHLELDTHDIILAEGAASESYRDTGNRSMFSRGLGVPAAPGGADVLPRIEWLASAAGTGEARVRLHAGAQAHAPIATTRGCWRFAVPALPARITLTSATGVPAALGLGADVRPLGLAVRALRFTSAAGIEEVAADAMVALGGLYATDRSRARWTDGAASLLTPPDHRGLFCAIDVIATALPAYPREAYPREAYPLEAYPLEAAVTAA